MRLFVPNKDLPEDLAKEPEFDDGLSEIADAVKAKVDETVRIMPRDVEPYEVEADEDGVRVVATDYGWAIAEYGSINSPAYAPLRRGVKAAGLRLDEDQGPE